MFSTPEPIHEKAYDCSLTNSRPVSSCRFLHSSMDIAGLPGRTPSGKVSLSCNRHEHRNRRGLKLREGYAERTRQFNLGSKNPAVSRERSDGAGTEKRPIVTGE